MSIKDSLTSQYLLPASLPCILNRHQFNFACNTPIKPTFKISLVTTSILVKIDQMATVVRKINHDLRKSEFCRLSMVYWYKRCWQHGSQRVNRIFKKLPVYIAATLIQCKSSLELGIKNKICLSAADNVPYGKNSGEIRREALFNWFNTTKLGFSFL